MITFFYILAVIGVSLSAWALYLHESDMWRNRK